MTTPLRIIQLTDLHIRSEPGKTMAGIDTDYYFSKVLEAVYTKYNDLDLLLLTGDLAQDPTHSSYSRIAAHLQQYKTTTVCLPGNHDDYSLMQTVFCHQTLHCNKLIQFSDWQIICLNSKKQHSQGGFLAKKEIDFLNNTLVTHTDKHTLIAVHHHSVPTHSQWMDTMLIENNHTLFSLLNNYSQVKVIVCGHIHQTMETYKDNLLILGTPSTCFQFKPYCDDYTLDDIQPGYRVLELYHNGDIMSKVHRVNI